MMTNKPLITALLISLLSASNLANAGTPKPPPPPPPPTVTVTDGGAPEANRLHLTLFQTVLYAVVNNEPVSTTETTIDGPTYVWSCSGPLPGYNTTNDDSPSTTLTSTAYRELAAGSNDVTVTCTVTYNSTDNATGKTTPLVFSGSTDVTFFVRVPTRVKATLLSNVKYGPPNDSFWGHETTYDLYLYDNQVMPQLYGNGTLSESFSNVQLNPAYAYNLQHSHPPAPGTPVPNGATPHTTDGNRSLNGDWTNPPTQDTGDTTLWYQFDQLFTCFESAPGYAKDPWDTKLNTFTLYVEQGQTIRGGG